jgi:predicted transcriptional regulator
MQMLSLGVRLDIDAIAKLDRIAAATGKTPSQILRGLVDQAEDPGPQQRTMERTPAPPVGA